MLKSIRFPGNKRLADHKLIKVESSNRDIHKYSVWILLSMWILANKTVQVYNEMLELP